ncbi:ABC transporter ATP-binding protein [Hyphomonas sp.]|uniref:ABC transporter ATP-binding protein n=1 Tax=Hyphomonas sp. TaxID=87 RepID=UPI001BD149E8|nr:ABC transporter ATP-binding protein [Hyphomonas sp.]
MADHVIDIEGLRFAWKSGPQVLDIETFRVGAGERVFLRGPSGSGKSTLLGLIAGVLEPQAGRISVMGQDMGALAAAKRDRLRADRMGVIFQMFNLVPYLSVTGNVLLPLRFSPARRKAAGTDPQAEARRLLARLGLQDESLLDRRVSDLSVGQQQRVAAARALIGSPSLVIADEPTSALDADARDRFINLLSEEVERSGASLLFVSHDASLAGLFTRAVDLMAMNKAGAPA